MALKELSFAFAYNFADRVVDELRIPEADYILDFLEPRESTFLEKAAHPSQSTLLHSFIYNLNASDLDYSTGHFPEESLETYVSILRSAHFNVPDWLNKEELGSHILELDKLLDQATRVITDATFHLLFSDREFLATFQSLIAKKLVMMDTGADSGVFEKPGILRRPPRLPSWLRRAVFLRDKGRCQSCFSDLTGTLALDPKMHLDHIRPLAQSGSNDPTNFQLLCESCNLKKGPVEGSHIFRTTTYW
jgi:hypothetical protein